MNKVFTMQNWMCVPDGTRVCPFLNAQDIASGLPFDLVEGFGIMQDDPSAQ